MHAHMCVYMSKSVRAQEDSRSFPPLLPTLYTYKSNKKSLY